MKGLHAQTVEDYYHEPSLLLISYHTKGSYPVGCDTTAISPIGS